MKALCALSIALGVALFADIACTAKLSLEGRSCPCTAGFVCCEETDICIADADFDPKRPTACAALTGGTKTSSAQRERPRALLVTEVSAGVSIAKASSPTCFATDRDALYWLNRDGSLGAVRTSAGAPVVIQPFLVPAASISACGLSRAGGYLFATLEKANSVLRLSVRTDASGGISIGDTADRIGTFDEPTALTALDENTLFVAEHAKKKLTRFDIAPGTTVEIAATGQPITQLVGSNGALFWTEDKGVVTRPAAPGSAVLYLSVEYSPTKLFLQNGRAYFVASNVLWSAPVDGKEPARRETGWLGYDSANSGLLNVEAAAFDGANLVTFQTDTLYATTFDGAEPRPLFKVPSSTARDPLLLAIDAKRYLWATSTDIWSASRPITPDP